MRLLRDNPASLDELADDLVLRQLAVEPLSLPCERGESCTGCEPADACTAYPTTGEEFDDEPTRDTGGAFDVPTRVP